MHVWSVAPKARFMRPLGYSSTVAGRVPPFDFSIGKLAYLTGPPLHVHCEQHDTFYLLEGVLRVQVGDEMIELMPGDFASVPPGIAHTFDNIRKDQPPVKVCNLMTPGGLTKAVVTAVAHESGPVRAGRFSFTTGIGAAHTGVRT
jgi:quercetin dioxygenase-like cupin family protein